MLKVSLIISSLIKKNMDTNYKIPYFSQYLKCLMHISVWKLLFAATSLTKYHWNYYLKWISTFLNALVFIREIISMLVFRKVTLYVYYWWTNIDLWNNVNNIWENFFSLPLILIITLHRIVVSLNIATTWNYL